jgi:hypothetical protein
LELQEGKNEKLKNISNKGKGCDPVTSGSLTLSGIFNLNSPAAERLLSLARCFNALSLPKFLREMNVHIFSLRSRRQNRAWGGARQRGTPGYCVSAHQAREAGGSFLLFAISSSLRLGQSLSPASRAGMINSVVPGVPLRSTPGFTLPPAFAGWDTTHLFREKVWVMTRR